MSKESVGASVRLIKKYPNRRLYDTKTSMYITVADIKQLVLDQENFRIVDAKSEEDLTHGVLLQIILEEESGNGMPMFTSPMLAHIIRFYGNAMQGIMATFLEKNIQAFIDIQSKFQEQSRSFYDGKAFGPELWNQFLSSQAPMVQAMMSNNIEESKNLFLKMQEQMQEQTRSMFSGAFPFAAPDISKADKTKK